jgi:hypothetical protein
MLTKARRIAKDSYLELVKQFSLIPIKDQRHYDEALALLGNLAIRGENDLDAGERDYLDALTQFVGDYEDKHLRMELGRMKPLQALKFLMRVRGTMRTSTRMAANRSRTASTSSIFHPLYPRV